MLGPVHSAIREAVPDRRWVYPEEHLATIGPFIWGTQRDPRAAFTLNSDMWDAWPYATNPREALRHQTRLRFNGLGSFLRPYAKWFCYGRLQAGTARERSAAAFPCWRGPMRLCWPWGLKRWLTSPRSTFSRSCGTGRPCPPICRQVNEPQERYACRPTPVRSGCGCMRTLEDRLASRGQCGTNCFIPLRSAAIGRI